MMSETFRKKPVEIEAMQLLWENWNDVCDFVGVGKMEDGKPTGVYIDTEGNVTEGATETIGLAIPTLEGVMIARQDDWIIRGVQGEFYPIKADIFEATYDRVTS